MTAIRRPEVSELISDQDWDGRELVDARHSATEFRDVDLTDAVVSGSEFDGCVFQRVRFNGARLRASAFNACVFLGCTFFDTEFDGCRLLGAAFDTCTFTSLRIVGGDWSFTSLVDGDLRRTTARGVRMRECDLTAANLDGAEWSECDLAGASWRAVSIVGTDLRGSDLSGLDPRDLARTGALIDEGQAIAVAHGLGFEVGPAT